MRDEVYISFYLSVKKPVIANAEQLRIVGTNHSAPHQKYMRGYYSYAEVKISHKA